MKIYCRNQELRAVTLHHKNKDFRQPSCSEIGMSFSSLHVFSFSICAIAGGFCTESEDNEC